MYQTTLDRLDSKYYRKGMLLFYNARFSAFTFRLEEMPKSLDGMKKIGKI